MNNDKDGGPAFPSHGSMGEVVHDGMTLRDYFAAKALAGFAADSEGSWKNGAKGMARCAYEWADAMLNAREGEADEPN